MSCPTYGSAFPCQATQRNQRTWFLKTSCCCCCCCCKMLTERGVYVHNLLRLIGRSPRQQRTLRHRGLRKLALNSGTTRRSAKNAQPYIATEPSLKAPVSVHTGKTTNSGDELNLRHLQQETQSTTCTTGTSTPMSALQLRMPQFSALTTQAPVMDATGMSPALSKNCTRGSTPHKLATSTYRHDQWHWHTTICSPAVGTC